MATITSLVDKAITIKEKQVVVAKEIVSRASINKGTIFTIGNYKITVRDYWFDLKYRSVALRLTVYRDGQEVKIINPVHFRGMPYTVQKGTKIVGYYAAEDIYVRIGKVKVGDPIYAPIHQENPLEALKQAVIRYLDGQPLGKTIDSNTTLVVYGSLGGSAGRYSAPGESWSTIRDSAGTFVDSESDIYTYIESTTTTNTWSQVVRGGLIFDTSGIPDNAVIKATSLTLSVAYTNENFTAAPELDIVSFTPETYSAIATGDYQGFGETPFASKALTPEASSVTHVHTLNAAGIATISKIGSTGFGIRINYDTDDSPTWESGKWAHYLLTLTAGDHFLTIEYASDRQFYQAASEDESTYNTNTTYQDKTTLTFTPDASSTYLILASWVVKENNTTYYAKAQLYNSTATSTLAEQIYYPKDTTDYVPGGAAVYETFGESPVETTYKIRYGTSNSSGTAAIKNARIVALKLGASDQYASATSRTTYSTNTTHQAKVTKTFTPEIAGDYLVIGSCIFDGSSSSYDTEIELVVDSTQYGYINVEPVNADNRHPYVYAQKVTLTQAEHNIYLNYATENTSGTAGCGSAYLVLLRLNDISGLISGEQGSPQTDTDGTQDHALTVDFSAAEDVDYLILACCRYNAANAGESASVGLYENTTDLGMCLHEPKDVANYHPAFWVYYKDSPSVDYYIDLKAESGSYDAIADDLRIYGLQLVHTPIITTATATKNISYTVGLVQAIDKPSIYTVGTYTSETKNIEYSVASVQTIQKDTTYTIATVGTDTKDVTYSVSTVSSTTKDVNYNVSITDTLEKDVTYSVGSLISTTKDVQYVVQSGKSLSKDIEYSLKTTQDIKKDVIYSVSTTSVTTKNVSYSVSTSSSITKDTTYDVSQYNYYTKQVSVTYCVTSTNSVTKDIVYSVGYPGSITKDSRYAVSTSTQLSKDISYSVATTTQYTKDTTYNVATATPLSKDIIYTVPYGATIQKNVVYEVSQYNTYTQTKDSGYCVTTTTSITKDTSYAVSTTGSVSKDVAYDVSNYTTQILTKDVTYCVSTTSSIAIEGPYCVSVGISTTKDVTYEVSQYAFYTLNKDVRYCVTATGSTTVNTEYTVSTVSTISKDTTYSVFSGTYHTVTKDTTYCVPATSSISKDIIYTLSTTSTVTKDSQYEIGTSSIHTITKDSQYMVRYKEYRSRIVKTRAGYGSVSHTFQSYFKYLVG